MTQNLVIRAAETIGQAAKRSAVKGQAAKRQRLLPLSLIASLLILSGCEGSQFGSRLENSLEPDPQLADQTADATDSSAQIDTPPTTPLEADPTPPEEVPTAEQSAPVTAGDYKDIGKAPAEIQPYLVDLLALDVLKIRPAIAPATPTPAPAPTPAEGGTSAGETAKPPTPAPKPPTPAGPDEFRPNQAMTRREYARWLLAVNNRLYEGDRNRQIRAGVTSSQPVFQDVPISDPDFGAIQGLTEAGIIPSPLTGSSTTVTFRPNAPLTRKDLVLWKVPLDTRETLPSATVSAVEQIWGFQDTAKIEPRALQAVLADNQNGDFANIRRAFGYTTLFQPDKAATRAEGAAVLWRFGKMDEGVTAADILSGGSSDSDDSSGSGSNDSSSATPAPAAESTQ
ncbi:MAG: S-layer homology domain-containing protein [Phormidesmis sp.]